jgi:protein-disulfide isomerase
MNRRREIDMDGCPRAGPSRALMGPLLLLVLVLPGRAAAQYVDVAKLGYDRGSPGAPILVTEFGDFGCSACGQFARDVWPQLQREFVATGRVRWKYIPFDLGMFPNGSEAASAAECAADQDAFWSMHDLLYEKQKAWNRLRDPRDKFLELARQLRLDVAVFGRCYRAEAGAARTKQNTEAARELMVRATPTFFVNGQRVVGALPIEEWRKLIVLVSGGR